MSVLDIQTAEVFEPLLAPARDKAARGGRGSGKSHFFADLMIEDCAAAPGESAGEGMFAVCIREVQKDLQQSAKRLIEQKLVQHRITEADGFKVYEDCITTPGDGLIIFKGMNNYTADSIKSLEGARRAWWEEAHTATQTSINLLRPTLRAKGSQLWWSYNPRHKKDPVDIMCVGPERPTGMVCVNANWRDNPWWTAELEQERLDCLRMQPDQYGHIYDGEYATVVSGAYYAKQLRECREQGRICDIAIDPMLPIRTFHDIGGAGAKADMYSMTVEQWVGPWRNIIDHYSAQGQPLAAHANWLRANGYENAEINLPHDGLNTNNVSGKTYEQHWRDAGFSNVRSWPNAGAGAAMQRVEATRRLFKRMRFQQGKTDGLLVSAGWYHAKIDEERGVDLGPEHDWASHDMDALGQGSLAYKEPTIGGFTDDQRLSPRVGTLA